MYKKLTFYKGVVDEGRVDIETKISIMHQWFNGRIQASQACDPGSIPGWCIKLLKSFRSNQN